MINLAQFADESAIDPMSVDRTYYLAPDRGHASDAFAVMREGRKEKVGVGKLALYGREYLVAVKPHERRIVMYNWHNQVTPPRLVRLVLPQGTMTCLSSAGHLANIGC